ncbi:triacylglycerol lipase [Glaciihabitans sp. dw_435]|uniref:esterase/lipase family protein n=1 Tax=Glaciihabitans sp. dw_435 TaxID=2720081 RepID=UPI001BD65595|nr:alpha/beta hydrolase [Glaciihabitans sp. dw_435]
MSDATRAVRRPRLTPTTLGWWIADYVYAAAAQVRGVVDRAEPASFRSGDGAPILVIPGIYETWQFMQPLVTALHDRGHPVHVIELLHRNRRPVIDSARHVADYLAEHDLHDVIIAAHSKGGLIGKEIMVHGSATSRVRGMVAVAAPFSGSSYARFLLLPSLRIFSPTDATIVGLARERQVNARIVSVYGRFDPHIPAGSYLDGARNVELDTGGHFRVLANPRVIAELIQLAE